MSIILAVSLVSKVSLALWIHAHNPSAIIVPDSYSYQNVALNLLHHGAYSRSQTPPFEFEQSRTPGYPALLAAVSAVLGPSAVWVVLLQALLATATVALTYLLGCRLFGSRAGLLASLALCIDIPTLVSSQQLLTETFFTALLCLGIWLLFRELSRPLSLTGLGLASLPLALATLVRPISYYLLPVLGVGVFAYAWTRDSGVHGGAARLRLASVALGVFMSAPVLLVGGWQTYKYVRTGQPYYSSIESVNLYYYRAAEVVAHLRHRTRGDVSREMRDSVGSLPIRPSDAELARQGLRILLRHPGQTLLMSTRGAASFLLEPGITDLTTLVGTAADQGVCFHKELLESVGRLRFPSVLWNNHRTFLLFTFWGFAYLALLYSGLVAVLVRNARGVLRSPSIVLLGILLYFLVATAGPESESRLRVPVMPILSLLGAGGWVSLIHLYLPPWRPPVAPVPPQAVTDPKNWHVPPMEVSRESEAGHRSTPLRLRR